MNPFDANDVYELLTDHCHECGAVFAVRPDDDDTVVCAPCGARRAPWAAVTEIRMAQASAPVKAVA
jgi:uncharacterized Zn finger protein (UPF0148 family)